MSFFKTKNKKIVIENYIALLFLNGASFLLPLIVLPYLVITLKSEKYGLVMIAQSLAVFFTIIIDFGFNISATREVAVLKKDKEKLSKYFWNVFFIKLCLIMVSFLILFFMVSFFDKFKLTPHVYMYSFGMVVGQAIFPSWFFQGIEKMKMITTINVLAKVIFTVSIFFFISSPNDYLFVPILNGLGFIISGLLGFFLSLKYVYIYSPKVKEMIIITKESSSLFISNFAVSLYTSSNTLVLGFLAGDTIAGVYTSMEKLVVATKSIYIPLYQAIFPYLSPKPIDKIYNIINRLKMPILILGLILSITIFIGSKEILAFVYKKDDLIMSYYKVFQILGLISLFSALNMLFMTLFLPAIKAYKVRMKILTFAGVFHITIIFILTNYFNIYGVAITASITELLILIVSFYYFKKLAV